MSDRVSQDAVEALYSTTGARARVSQDAVEVLYEPATSNARVSQAVVEVLLAPHTVATRTSQIAVELLIDDAPAVMPFIDTQTVVYPLAVLSTFVGGGLSQLTLEAMGSDTTAEGFVSQVTLEVLIPRPFGLHVWSRE